MREDISKALQRFINIHGRAWQLDTEDGFTNRERKSTKDTWEASDKALIELKQLLETIP